MDTEKLLDYTKILLNKRQNTCNATLKNSLMLLLYNSINPIKIILIFMVIILLGILISFNTNTVELFLSIHNSIISIIGLLLGINFTAYALVFTLSSSEMTLTLLQSGSHIKDYSLLDFFNSYFLGLNAIYFFLLLLDYLLDFIISNFVPNDFLLFDQPYSNISAFLLIAIYLIAHIFFIVEFLTSMFNLYRCFNINVSVLAVKALENLKSNE